MLKKLIVVVLFVQSLFAVDATMEIIKKATNLPVVAFAIGSDTVDKAITYKLKTMVAQDLSVSGHFNVSNATVSVKYNEVGSLERLKDANVDLFVLLNTYEEFGKLHLQYKLFDLNANSLVLNKQISTNAKDRYPFLAHKASIQINNYFDAPGIDWMDKFVIFSRYTAAKKSEIVIADYTLTYQKVIIKGGLNIFPKWSGSAQKSFYYTTYNKFLPTVMKYNLYNGKKEYIAKSDGMIVCSDVSEDGNKLLLTMAPDAQPDIYLYDTKTKQKKKLTRYKGIDVGAQFVENDTRIVFVSDRLGKNKPNVFAKTIGSRGVERLVYYGKNNNSCTAYKDYIVYTSKEGNSELSRNNFNLYLISTTSDYLRQLTMTGKNQFPKFSADGETIIFTKEYKGRSSLGIMRLNYNKSFLFPLKSGKLQSIDW